MHEKLPDRRIFGFTCAENCGVTELPILGQNHLENYLYRVILPLITIHRGMTKNGSGSAMPILRNGGDGGFLR